jgi:lambda repressor-like predicted transcriptional regulator
MQIHVQFNESGRLVGESHPHARLTDADVDLVFGLRENGMSIADIGVKMGVSKSCIQHILSGRNRGQPVARRLVVSVAG